LSGSFLPEPFWLVCTTEVYSGVGAGVVMESMSDLVRGEQGISIANHVLDQSWSAINNCKKQLARP
jgi:hypothetical protein